MQYLDVDVLVVGAGLSGIGAACRIRQLCPDETLAVLEARPATGGTWDLFRYPGVRSDSDMSTLSYPFRPWDDARSLADGESIRTYIRETAREFGVDELVHHGQQVVAASWSSRTSRWTVRAETDEGLVEHTARFLHLCTGYYSYDTGHVVDFPGRADFDGPIIHPQFWPPQFVAEGKRIVVVGSGATAITLVPALAAQGATRVTMLQRSPTYVLAVAGTDPVGRVLRRVLPPRAAHRVLRAKNVALNVGLYEASRRFPEVVKRVIARGAESRVGPEQVREHFTPRYQPWDQRLCVVPDGDFFDAVADGSAEVVTDTVERFTATGIRLASGRELRADAVVTATGLRLEVAGGVALAVDGERVVPSERYLYKGVLLDGVPNLGVCLGYTNNSWTLRADLSSRYVCTVLQRMRESGSDTAIARLGDDVVEGDPPFELTAGYLERSRHLLPRQGRAAPWRVRQNYYSDRRLMSSRRVEDGVLELARAGSRAPAPTGA